jgi:hypothetical protein
MKKPVTLDTLIDEGYTFGRARAGMWVFTNPANVSYVVHIAPDSCTCPGFTYRGACKHVNLSKKLDKAWREVTTTEKMEEEDVPF